MSTTTTTMGLVKPALTEAADIGIINDDLDVLDAHRHAGGASGLQIQNAGIESVAGSKVTGAVGLATSATNADTVDSVHAGTAAGNALVLDGNALVPLANIPTALTGKTAANSLALGGTAAASFSQTNHTHATVPNHDHSGDAGDGGALAAPTSLYATDSHTAACTGGAQTVATVTITAPADGFAIGNVYGHLYAYTGGSATVSYAVKHGNYIYASGSGNAGDTKYYGCAICVPVASGATVTITVQGWGANGGGDIEGVISLAFVRRS